MQRWDEVCREYVVQDGTCRFYSSSSKFGNKTVVWSTVIESENPSFPLPSGLQLSARPWDQRLTSFLEIFGTLALGNA
jgi:hypothetical protein